MGLDAKQLREYVVRPALHEIGLHSDAAEALVMGTAAQESRLVWLHQLGGGPALGLFQMEPATFYDIWDNYLAYKQRLARDILDACGIDDASLFDGRPEPERLQWDLRLAAIMCRVHYRRVRAPLPHADDLLGLARYWKAYYNTEAGAGTVDEFLDNFELVK